jgi:sugar phosphate isomerase/epimerase
MPCCCWKNEKEIVGDTVARCYRLMCSLASDHFRFLWDPANFVQVGEGSVTDDAWDLLGKYVGYIHIKDALLGDASVVAAGQSPGARLAMGNDIIVQGNDLTDWRK